MKKETTERLIIAKTVNLAEYLISRHGIDLKRVGSYHEARDHDSLVFKGNLFYWNSQDEKGDAIKYLQLYHGMSFYEAVRELSDYASYFSKRPHHEAAKAFDIADLKLSTDMRRTFAYLSKTRGINYALVKELTDQKLIMQEAETNNIVFPMYDDLGSVVGAELCGTLTAENLRFKGIKTGSMYGVGYTIQRPDEKTEFVLFFESAIDLLSFIELRHMAGKSLKGCTLVSLAGLKANIFNTTIKRYQTPVKAVICVDNDEAGQIFIESIKAAKNAILVRQPAPQFKDWNEQLKNIKGIITK